MLGSPKGSPKFSLEHSLDATPVLHGRSVAAGFAVNIFAPLASRDVFLVFHLFDAFVCSACHPVFTSEFVCEFVNKLS